MGPRTGGGAGASVAAAVAVGGASPAALGRDARLRRAGHAADQPRRPENRARPGPAGAALQQPQPTRGRLRQAVPTERQRCSLIQASGFSTLAYRYKRTDLQRTSPSKFV